jgi:nucleotide sugar dehydrogenase
MNIGVIGVGRLGICFALLLEKAGYSVFGSDKRIDYINDLNKKTINTSEPYVTELLTNSRNITFTTDNKSVINNSEIIYMMVATPSLPDGSYDTTAIWEVIKDVKECGNLQNKILVIGCTTNPGDSQKIQDSVEDLGIKVLYNPEFIAQGSIVRDLQKADMVLIGGNDQVALDKFSQLYWDIQTTQPKIHTMSLTAAELCKIAVNCFLTTKISYANMVGEVLLKSGLESDVDKVLKAIGEDTRVGPKYLKFGFGYGGPCLPRDNRAFAHYAKQVGIEFDLGSVVDNFNKSHAEFLKNYYMDLNVDKLPFYFPYLAYKPATDIMEESQQFKLCIDLLDMGYTVYAEEDDLIPQAYKNLLSGKYKNFSFVKIEKLKEQGIKVLPIAI